MKGFFPQITLVRNKKFSAFNLVGLLSWLRAAVRRWPGSDQNLGMLNFDTKIIHISLKLEPIPSTPIFKRYDTFCSRPAERQPFSQNDLLIS